ncbi:MAG: hypothetical protein EZS28_005542 [Streblomastix strix]|uniref:Uncharacterized protein n=1 Tax=Streblomastix strix TaxID=222440 RepID=A0A5J4WVS9_9EUKA|nr:MAG: hypothetical protein EZS28_005542 [Streblomastix strix]
MDALHGLLKECIQYSSVEKHRREGKFTREEQFNRLAEENDAKKARIEHQIENLYQQSGEIYLRQEQMSNQSSEKNNDNMSEFGQQEKDLRQELDNLPTNQYLRLQTIDEHQLLILQYEQIAASRFEEQRCTSDAELELARSERNIWTLLRMISFDSTFQPIFFGDQNKVDENSSNTIRLIKVILNWLNNGFREYVINDFEGNLIDRNEIGGERKMSKLPQSEWVIRTPISIQYKELNRKKKMIMQEELFSNIVCLMSNSGEQQLLQEMENSVYNKNNMNQMKKDHILII